MNTRDVNKNPALSEREFRDRKEAVEPAVRTGAHMIICLLNGLVLLPASE